MDGIWQLRIRTSIRLELNTLLIKVSKTFVCVCLIVYSPVTAYAFHFS